MTTSAKRDYVEIAKRYARRAADEKNRRTFGKWTRRAASRFLRDLDRAEKGIAPFQFVPREAHRACRFIELLPHVEGQWETPTIVMHDAHVFATVNIFGFRKPDGTRRFTLVVFAVARKNAKSTWAAGVMLYCQVCEGELGPQVISAAKTGQQARIVFNVARRMVEKTPALRDEFGVEAWANSIVSTENGGLFRPINAKASSQDGLNPSAISLDEVHAHDSHDLFNVLRSAAGARRNLLMLLTTTEGYETPGPWPEIRKFAQQILDGVIEADHFFALIYALDDADPENGIEADDIFDSDVWIKANPLIEVNPLLKAEIAKEAIEAKANPGQQSEFSIKRCNRQASIATAWINLAKWKIGGGKFDPHAFKGAPCFGGIDLGSVSDITCARLVWLVEGVLYTWGRRWVPENQVKERSVRGTVPYQAWIAEGLIEQTPGDVTDYRIVRDGILEMNDEFHPETWAYDRWNATQIVNELLDQGVPMVEFIQGPKSYHPAMKFVERAYLSGNLRHGGCPVLQWMASNVVVRYDVNLNMAPDKRRSAEKIDDFAALLMAAGVATGEADGLDLGPLLDGGAITA